MDPSRSDKKNRIGRVNGLYISSGPDQMFDCERKSLGGARKKDPRPNTHEAQINGPLRGVDLFQRRSHRVSGQVKDNIFSKLLGIGLNALNTFRGTLNECSKYFSGHFD
jgi:hypothetical protein